LNNQLDNKSTKIGYPVTDTKSEIRIIGCTPPTFSGADVEYIPWKRTWEKTMGISLTNEEMQLTQLTPTIPTRISDLIGLSGIKSTPEFWRQMYLDYNTHSSSTLEPITKEKNSITSDEMVEERYCHFCHESHPFGSHTRSRAESKKSAIRADNGQQWEMAASMCRHCKEMRKAPQTCGACSWLSDRVGACSVFESHMASIGIEWMYRSCIR
jgi:hypothetical protein